MCGDSSTIVLTEAGEYYAWGRGACLDRQVDVSRFKPKLLDSVDIDHTFLLPGVIPPDSRQPTYVSLTNQPVVVNLNKELIN